MDVLLMSSHRHIVEIQKGSTQWLWSYNNERPHMALEE